jgi:hypothetical protein
MAKTYLELVKDVHRECRVTGASPITVSGHTGLINDIVNWVRDAYKDIQDKHPDWRWMRAPFQVSTAQGVDAYAAAAVKDVSNPSAPADIARFGAWQADDIYNPIKATPDPVGDYANQFYLPYLEWNAFRRIYKFGARQTQQGRPAHISVDDQQRLVVGPIPDGVYVIDGDYQRSAQILTTNTDIPDMPDYLHDLIAYYAMARYGTANIAVEVIARAQDESRNKMLMLEYRYLPSMGFGGSLA